MEITFIDDCQANLELTDLEITIFNNVFVEVKKDLNYAPEYQVMNKLKS